MQTQGYFLGKSLYLWLWYFPSKIGQGRDRKGSHGNAFSAVKPRAGLWQGSLSSIAMTSQHTKYPKSWAQIHGVPASFAAHSVHYRQACQWWGFSLPDVASHLGLARPLSSLQTWTWTQLNKISGRDEGMCYWRVTLLKNGCRKRINCGIVLQPVWVVPSC